MVMTEKDEQLVMAFFEENRQQITDNGFSERVRRHLPTRASRLNRIWLSICSVAGVALFLLVDGFANLHRTLLNIGADILCFFAGFNLTGISPLMVMAALVTFTFIVVYNVYSSES